MNDKMIRRIKMDDNLRFSKTVGVSTALFVPFYAQLGFGTEGFVSTTYCFLAITYLVFGVGCFLEKYTIKPGQYNFEKDLLLHTCMLFCVIGAIFVVVFVVNPSQLLR